MLARNAICDMLLRDMLLLRMLYAAARYVVACVSAYACAYACAYASAIVSRPVPIRSVMLYYIM
jgi:hypothetical protein